MKQANYKPNRVILCFMLVFTGGCVSAGQIESKNAQQDANDGTLWYDCKLLQIDGKGWVDTESFYDRLPEKARKTAPTNVWILSHNSAGICVRFKTDAASVKVRWKLLNKNLALPHMPATGVSGVDLYARDKSGRWCFVKNGRPIAVSNVASFNLTSAEEYMLYLPLYNGVKSVEIGLDKKSTVSKPAASTSKPIVFYGTSITQGACASRPGMAATAIVGRRLDIPVINLGFSGSAKMEPEMADLLSELDPAVYVIDCLWNMNNLDPNEVSQRAGPLVRKLRTAHPDTPILLVEDSNFKNITPTPKGYILRSIYEKLKKQDIKNLYFLSNESMLGKDGEGTVDGCHPNDLGMMRQADVFIKALLPILQRQK